MFTYVPDESILRSIKVFNNYKQRQTRGFQFKVNCVNVGNRAAARHRI